MIKYTIRALTIVLALAATGCAAGKALHRGDDASKKGDYDQAVAYYREAVQASPDKPEYKIALERAMLVASRVHLDRARDYESHEQMEAARSEYKLASEYDPGNGFATFKITELDQKIRDRMEAARPRQMDQLRAAARTAAAPPMLNPASREPIRLAFNGRLGDVLMAIGNAAGINVSYDRDVNQGSATSIQLDGVTLEQALNQIMAMNQLSYKVINERSIFVFQDNAGKHNQYDDQLIQTFYVANADVTELSQMLSTIARFAGAQFIQPIIMPNKTANTITVRGTSAMVEIIDKVIEQNDKPKAEILFDVEILEVDRNRAKQYGLNLTEYAVGTIFSPEVSPNQLSTTTVTTPNASTTTGGRSTPPNSVTSPPAFNVNTISRGISNNDFYLAVPAAIARFLESDTHTKLIAKPQLRGADGAKISVKLGTDVPIVSTTYTPIATGGAGVNPLNSFTFRSVGINMDITPRVSLDGDISVDLMLESSTKGADQNIAGTNYPQFGTRQVTTHLRLRDGESNLLAGLLRQDEANSTQGFPGAIHVPLLKQLFSGNDNLSQQTDIVMLLTPHIIRSSEITANDLKPIYIGAQQNIGLGGPPPLIAPDQVPGPAPQTPPITQPNTVPGAPTVAPPPGSSPVPGTVVVPPPGAAAAPAQPAAPSAALTPAGGAGTASASQPGAVDAAAQRPPSTVTSLEPPSPSIGTAQVAVTPPNTPFRVGGGPYNVPISVSNASRLSTVSLTVTFDPAILRVRSVQEGSFMRTGGVNAVFANQPGNGRVDITITRAADSTGASGTGVLGSILFDAVAPGTATISVSGVATAPGGTPAGLQFRPAPISVQQ
jgi:general secretion pathway protein D